MLVVAGTFVELVGAHPPPGGEYCWPLAGGGDIGAAGTDAAGA
jgi:hypothetical protein